MRMYALSGLQIRAVAACLCCFPFCRFEGLFASNKDASTRCQCCGCLTACQHPGVERPSVMFPWCAVWCQLSWPGFSRDMCELTQLVCSSLGALCSTCATPCVLSTSSYEHAMHAHALCCCGSSEGAEQAGGTASQARSVFHGFNTPTGPMDSLQCTVNRCQW